jgi:hypothetical protein
MSAAATQNPDELAAQLRYQLEFYFSPENLARDSHLTQQMDGEGYVNISVIASFGRVCSMTTDIGFVTQTMRDSKVLQVDESGTKVRVRKKPRTTLILRSIPNSLSSEEVKAFFSIPNCPVPQSCKPEYGDTWFVSFGSQADVEQAEQLVRDNAQYNGKPIKCHIKNETVSVNFMYNQHNIAPQYGGWSPGAPYFPHRYNQNNSGFYPPRGANLGGRRQNHRVRKQHDGSRRLGGAGNGRVTRNNDRTNRTPRGKGKRGDPKKAPEPDFGAQDFPALVSSAQKVPHAPLKRLDRNEMCQAIAALCRNGPCERPENFPAPSHDGYVRETPLTETQLNETFPVYVVCGAG